MFPLQTKSLPANADALRAALEESLRQLVRPSAQIVSVEDKDYPNLAALRLTLDDAHAIEPPRRPAPAMWSDRTGIAG